MLFVLGVIKGMLGVLNIIMLCVRFVFCFCFLMLFWMIVGHLALFLVGCDFMAKVVHLKKVDDHVVKGFPSGVRHRSTCFSRLSLKVAVEKV